MKPSPAKSLACALLVLGAAANAAWAWPIAPRDVKQNNRVFNTWFGTELTWHYASMPKRASLPSYRMPYAGYIYPDKQGGCESVLWKYDRAFGTNAVGWERHDIAIHMERKQSGGFFGGGRVQTPDWAGHCNGWTAASIRHAEPQKSVNRNGVTFTPADIKGLLAELYVYSGVEMLGGENNATINPGMLHVIVTNWISLGKHPVGMDNAAGKEIWNYPIYAYAFDGIQRGRNRVEVRCNIAYVYMLDQEYHRAPKKHYQIFSLHYDLDLNNDGEIIGGNYYGDSKRVDIAWVPLKPTRGGTKGNEQGCPHLDPKEVLALWRASVPEETRKNWWNIDPTKEDGIVETNFPLESAEPTRSEQQEASRRPITLTR
jgi:hypothetical protein